MTNVFILKGLRISKIRNFSVIFLLTLLFLDVTIASKKKDENKSEKSEGKDDKKEDDKKKGDKKTTKDLKEPGTKEDKKPAAACNHQLLTNFRLQGLAKDEAASNMLACTNVTAGNNCCSKIDEIKIIKGWNAYSVPILDKFADDMVANYKKVLSFNTFVRSLDAKKGRYHYSKYTWHKSAEEKCYDGKYFVSKTGIGKLHAKMDWNQMLAEKTGNYILNHTIEKLDTEGLLDRGVISKLQKALKKDKEIHQKLMDARPGFGMKYFVDSIEEIYLQKIVSVGGTDLNTSEKKKEQSVTAFLKAKLEIGGTLQAYMDEEYKSKNIKDLQAFTAEKHIHFIMKHVNWFIKTKKNQNELVVKAIKRHMTESGGLKKKLEYFLLPEKLKEKKVYDSMYNYLLKSITDTVIKSKDIKGNNYNSLVEILNNIKSHLRPKNRMYYTFRYNLVPYIIYNTISHMCENLSKNKHKVYSEADLKAIITNLDFNEFKDKKEYALPSHSKTKMNFSGHKHNFIKSIKKVFKKVKKKAAVSVDDHANKSKADIDKIMSQAYNKTVKELQEEIKKIKPPETQKALVCAVVYHSNLFREVRFNQEKMDYCMSVEADFKAHKMDVAETIELIDKLRPQLRGVLELKRGFYCSMCDKSATPFIDIKKQKMTFSKNFCVGVIKEYKKYLEWKNVIFMEYLLKLFQYLKCFSDDGTPQKMPFGFMDPEHEEAFPSMKSCLEMKSEKEVGNCLDICNSFEYVTYSPVFDGDKKFLHKMINFILTVVRTHGFTYNRILEAEPPGSKIKDRRLSVESLYGQEENQFGDFDDVYVDDDYWRHSRYLADEKKEDKKDEKKDDKKDEKKEGEDKNAAALPKAGEKKPVVDKSAPPKKEMTIYDFQKNIGKAKAYSRIKYYNHNEVARSHRTYNVTEPYIDFENFSGVIEDSGMDPLAVFKGSNFDPAVAHMLVGAPVNNHEKLDKAVVRVLISIDTADLIYFNTQLDNAVGDQIPEDEEDKNKEADKAKEEAKEEKKAENAKPKVKTEKKAEGDQAAEGNGKEGATVTDGGDDKQPRQLYGKLYRKLYKKKKRRGLRRSYHKRSNPFMKAMIDILF